MNKNKAPFFLIGGRYRGYLLVKELIKNKENLVGAFVMREDEHEYEKYSEKIIEVLEENNIPCILAKNINQEKYKKFIKEKNPLLIIVMGWRTIISEDIISLPKYGCVAVHESLLPKYRGFAPVNWAVINGEKNTGVTLFHIANDIDNGDIIAQEIIAIGENDTAYEVYKKTSHASIRLVNKYLPLLSKGIAPKKKQNEIKATFACMRLPEDGLIRWNNPSRKIYNLIRGLSYPYPGAYSLLNGKKITIWKASIPTKKIYVGKIPGRIVKIIPEKGIEVITGDSTILLEEIQFDGKEKTKASNVINSIRMTFGK